MASNHYNKNDLLVTGYIRSHYLNHLLIPSSIFLLFIKFYKQVLNNHLVLFTENVKTYDLEIKMIKSNKTLTFKLSGDTINFKPTGNAAYFVQYNINDKLKSEYNTSCDSMLVRCGGMNGSKTKLIFFDSNQEKNQEPTIDGYVHTLPEFEWDLGAVWSSFLYDNYNNVFLHVGGSLYEDDDGLFFTHLKDIWYIKDNDKKWSQLKDILPEHIDFPSTQILSAQNKSYLIAGGSLRNGTATNKCYQLIEKENEWKLMNLASMNCARYAHCNCRFIKNTIIVGAGDGDKTFEIYDIKKNKWMLLQTQCNYSHRCGTMWIDNMDSNIVYIAGDVVKPKARVYDYNKHFGGFIEFKDLRENNKNWHILMDEQDLKQPLDLFSSVSDGLIHSILT